MVCGNSTKASSSTSTGCKLDHILIVWTQYTSMDPKTEKKLHGSSSPWSPQVRSLNSSVKNEVYPLDARYISANNTNKEEMQGKHIANMHKNKLGSNPPRASRCEPTM